MLSHIVVLSRIMMLSHVTMLSAHITRTMSKAVTRTSRTWMRSPPPLALPQAHPRLSRHCPGPNPPRPPFTSSPSSLVVTSRLIWSRPLCSQPPLIPHPLVSQPGPTPVHLVEKHGRLRGKRNSCQEKGCCAFLTGRCGSRGQLVGMSGMLYGLHARKYALAPTSLSSGLLSPKVWRVFFPVGCRFLCFWSAQAKGVSLQPSSARFCQA